MLPALINIAPFKQAIANGDLILTPNQRLAAKITQAWGELMSESSNVWPAPRVYSLEHWLKQCWNELQDQNHPLTGGLSLVGGQQSRYYWERAIAQHNPELNSRYAKLAADALKIVQTWNLTAAQVPGDNPSSRQFKAWAASYTGLLSWNKLVTPATSWQRVADGFVSGALPCESTIALYGFQSIPPLQETVIQAAATAVTRISASGSHSSAVPVSIKTKDPQHELRLAADWAARQLKENSQQRIGIVVPELNSALTQVVRTVEESLATHNCDVIFNISAGTPLSQTPLANTALEIIGAVNHKASLQQWLNLLYSPHSTLDSVRLSARANAELALRKNKQFDYSFVEFLTSLTQAAPASINEQQTTSPVLQPLIELSRDLLDSSRGRYSGQKTFSAWAGLFSTLLDRFGWPGARTLNSIEYQQRQHWGHLLEQFSALDNLGIEVGYSTALKHLQQLAKEMVFHPQTGDAPLQILGLLEGAGLRFDQLWIVDMHSRSFPAAVAINPLLPAEFQRAQGMPHSLPERELQIAEDLLADYKINCQRLILSYPEARGEEELSISPLLRQSPVADYAALSGSNEPDAHPPWLYQADQCLTLGDRGPRYDPATERIRGGSELLKNQSTCPFNAFAAHRLKAEALEEPSQGLSAMERGTLLHDILFRLWRDWQTSAHFKSLSEHQVAAQVSAVINGVLVELAPKHTVLQGPRYRGLEQARLEKLILAWLEKERERPPFEVHSLESRAQVSFGDLTLNLRLDRVDRVGEKLLIIDYKSGAVSAKDWGGSRPRDPQLPLYILASEPAANGCAFAQIKGGAIQFIGASDSGLLPGEEPGEEPVADWPAQTAAWSLALNNLAAEFVTGDASVVVHNKAAFAFQSHYLPLNRSVEQCDLAQASEESS